MSYPRATMALADDLTSTIVEVPGWGSRADDD
jgi:hypothetical protein